MSRSKIDVVEGDTWQIEFDVKMPDGSPYSFTGLTAHMDIRRVPGSSEALAQLSSPSAGITLNSPSTGKIAVKVPITATEGVCKTAASAILFSDLELRSGDAVPVITTIALIQWNVTRESTLRV